MSAGSNANLIARSFGMTFAQAVAKYDALPLEERDTFMLNVRKRLGQPQQAKAAGVVRFIGMPPPPQVPKKMKQPEYLAFLLSILGISRTTPVRVATEVEKDGVKSKTFKDATNQLQYMVYPVDRWAVQTVQHLCPIMADHYLGFARKSVLSSGTEPGLLKRLKLNLTRDPFVPHPTWDIDTMITSMMTSAEEMQFPDEANESTYQPNLQSSAGMPWVTKKKGEVIGQIIKYVNLYFELFSKSVGAASAYFTEHPDEYTIMIKNKTELTELDDYLEKTRPYFVYPAALQTLYSMFMQIVLHNVLSCQDDPDSTYMPGFSWVGGGMERLLNRAKALHPGRYYVCVYSDDIHIFLRLEDGRVCLICPDVRGLDGSFRMQDIPYLQDFVMRLVPFCPPAWRNVGIFLVHHAINAPTLFEHSLRMNLKVGLHSGIPGTTLLDFAKVQNALSGILTPEYRFTTEDALKDFIKELVQRFTFCGMTLKTETLEHEILFDAQDSPLFEISKLKILGQRIKRFKFGGIDTYIPTPDIERMFSSLVRPRIDNGMSQREKYVSIISRSAGLVVSGGWQHPDFYDCCRYLYDHNRTQLRLEIGQRPELMLVPGLSDPDGDENAATELQSLFFDSDNLAFKPMPMPYVFAKLYTGYDPLESERIELPVRGTLRFPHETVTVDDIAAQLADMPTDLATAMQNAGPSRVSLPVGKPSIDRYDPGVLRGMPKTPSIPVTDATKSTLPTTGPQRRAKRRVNDTGLSAEATTDIEKRAQLRRAREDQGDVSKTKRLKRRTDDDDDNVDRQDDAEEEVQEVSERYLRQQERAEDEKETQEIAEMRIARGHIELDDEEAG